MSMANSSLGPRSIPHDPQPLFKQVQMSEPPHNKTPYRVITETGFVMWVGNLESSASLDELYVFFRKIDPEPLPPEQSAVVSIMYMPSTNCALVNMQSEATLREAVERFHGSRLRPNAKSARLVCRRRGGEPGSESSLTQLPESGPSRWVAVCSVHTHAQGTPSRSPSAQKSARAVDIPEGSRFFVLKSIDHVSIALPITLALCTETALCRQV
jgi:hypothetical protein